MKKVSFGVALMVSALVVGCQDSSNYNPISSEVNIAPAKRADLLPPVASEGSIEINQVVQKGRTYESAEAFLVVGNVSYSIYPSGEDQPDMYELKMVSDVRVQSFTDDNNSYPAADEAVMSIQIPKGAQRIERSLSLYSVDRPLRLFLQYDVTKQSVELVSVQIDDDPFMD